MTVIMLSQLVCLTFYTVFNLWSLYSVYIYACL